MKKLTSKIVKTTVKSIVTNKCFIYTACAVAVFMAFSEAYASNPVEGAKAGRSIDECVDTVGTLITGKFARYGISGATIVGAIFAAAQYSMKAALSIMGIGAMLSYFLSFVNSSNFGN